jgi:hypothetical protein
MQQSPRGEKRQRGQILVLFELSLLVILGFTALVVDLGMLRNNRQILVNTIDAAALAGGSLMPVDPTVTGHHVEDVENLIEATVQANYPGLILDKDYKITYRCLIGVTASNQPRISDVPIVCDPHNALGHAAVASDFIGAGPTRSSDCKPHLGDKCNVVLVSGHAITDYALAPVVGVHSGNTGEVSAAACKGPCGAAPVIPVDLVIILDRTYSMTGSSGGMVKITALKNAANAVLSVYDPAKQRVALVLTGPGVVNTAGAAITSTSCSPTAYGYNEDKNLVPRTYVYSAISSTTALTIQVGTPMNLGFPSVPFNIVIDDEEMTVTKVSGSAAPYTWTVSRKADGTKAATHSKGDTSNYNVYGTDPWTASSTSYGRWLPVGLTGTDTTSPLPNPSEAYSSGGAPNPNSAIVKAINCIYASSMETDLATPIKMAQWYLDHYGRTGVTQGIILETDGHPQMGFDSDVSSSYQQIGTNSAFTCQAAIDAATAAKNDHTKSADGIQIFTIGYGVDSGTKCPIRTSSLSASTQTYNRNESTTWSGVSATTLLRTMATDSQHYFENPSSSQLAAVFAQAATMLSKGGAHLIQLYPAPIVTGVSGGTTATVSGKYFTGATSVTFGGGAVGFTVNGDTSITATVPAGPHGTTVDVIVTTSGGISAVTAADHYTYP